MDFSALIVLWFWCYLKNRNSKKIKKGGENKAFLFFAIIPAKKGINFSTCEHLSLLGTPRISCCHKNCYGCAHSCWAMQIPQAFPHAGMPSPSMAAGDGRSTNPCRLSWGPRGGACIFETVLRKQGLPFSSVFQWKPLGFKWDGFRLPY